MGKNIKKTYFTFRKEMYEDVKQEFKKIEDSINNKWKKFHMNNVKGYFAGFAFTIKINLIIYMLMWMNIIPHSYTQFQLFEIVIRLSFVLMISSLLTNWLFKDKREMRTALKMSLFNTFIMYQFGIYTEGMPLL